MNWPTSAPLRLLVVFASLMLWRDAQANELTGEGLVCDGVTYTLNGLSTPHEHAFPRLHKKVTQLASDARESWHLCSTGGQPEPCGRLQKVLIRRAEEGLAWKVDHKVDLKGVEILSDESDRYPKISLARDNVADLDQQLAMLSRRVRADAACKAMNRKSAACETLEKEEKNKGSDVSTDRFVRRIALDESVDLEKLDCKGTLAETEVVRKAFCSELDFIQNLIDANDCRKATAYVGPDGALRLTVQNELSVCVDTADFAPDSRIHVSFSANGQSASLSGFPGERLLVHNAQAFLESAVIHIEVTGFVRGRALRALVHQFDAYSAVSAAPAEASSSESSDASSAGAPAKQAATSTWGALAVAYSSLEDDRRKFEEDGRGAVRAGLSEAVDTLHQQKSTFAAIKDVVSAYKDPDNAKGPALADINASEEQLEGVLANIRREAVGWRDARTAQNGVVAVHDTFIAALPRLPASLPDNATPQAMANTAGKIIVACELLIGLEKKVTDDAKPYQDLAISIRANELKLQPRVEEYCQLTRRPTRLVEHDLLIKPGQQRVLQYDFHSGFKRALGPSSSEAKDDQGPVLVQIDRVPANATVSIALGNKAVATTHNNMVGLDRAAPDKSETDSHAVASVSALQIADELRSQLDPPGLPGTYIARIGRLDAGYSYDVTVCDRTDATDPTCAGKSRLIGKQRLEVHGRSYLGVRIGMAMNLAWGTDYIAVPFGGEAAGWKVKAVSAPPTFSLPLLLTVYPFGRDTLASGPSFAWGIGMGVNLLSPTKGLYPLEFSFDPMAGVGVSIAWSLVQTDVPQGTDGAFIAGERPDLGARFDKRTEWRHGVLIGVTLDADLFRIVFGNVFDGISGKLPKAAASSGEGQGS